MKKMLSSIKFKLISFLLLITLLPCILILTFLMRTVSDVVRAEVMASQQNGLEYTMQSLDAVFQEVDFVSVTILLDQALQQEVSQDLNTISQIENRAIIESVRKTLTTLKTANSNIDSIFLADLVNERAFSTEFYGYATMENAGYNAADVLSVTKHPTGWYSISNDIWNPVSTVFTGSSYVVSRKQVCSYKAEEIFALFINVSENTVINLLNNAHYSVDPILYFTDENHNNLLHNQNDDLFDAALTYYKSDSYNANNVFVYEGNEYLFSTLQSKQTGCYLFALTPFQAVNAPIHNIETMIHYVAGASFLLLLFFAIYVYFSFYTPTTSLVATMKENQNGHFTLTKIAEQKDEFGDLGQHFNSMLTQMTELSGQVHRQEIAAKDAHIKLLQSQINPHFLYNVLDNMHWMARMNRVQEVSEMTLALSRYYREVLNEGKKEATVAEAMRLIDVYWDIMKLRFGDKVDLIVDVEDTLLSHIIPKRLLQPLVENALSHGLERSGHHGCIIVSGIDLADTMKFVVEDNGTGMSEERLDEILQTIEQEQHAKGCFALRNIYQQLKLAYGECATFKMESEENNGTTITIEIPKTM